MPKKKMTPEQLKNLPQYRNKSYEELEIIAEDINRGSTQGRIESVIDRFKEDFDLSDMTANDHLALDALARAFILSEDLARDLNIAREEERYKDFGSINRELHRVHQDISTFQDDLNITRKARQDTGEHSVVEFIEDLKSRGKKFLKERLSEIYCPQCNMLIAKVWFLYPKQNNEMKLVCEKCGKITKLKSSDIEVNKNVEVGPPF